MIENWYYAANGQTFGPFTLEVLEQMVRAGTLKESTPVAKPGARAWQPFHEISQVRSQQGQSSGSLGSDLLANLAGRVSQASGLERLEGFSVAHLFSQVFRKHTPEEIEEHFSAGTVTTTPPLSSVVANWPTPWAFFRLLGLSLLVSVGFYWAMTHFTNRLLVPGWIFAGCFGIPFAVLVFFVESNLLRNVSFYRLMNLLILGGLLSLIASLLIFDATNLASLMGAMSAGIVEETGKLLAVIYFTRKWHNYGWILNGMLFGAAVGTGFSAFESAGYVFVSMLSNGAESETVMTSRAFLSPFTHSIWTAATAAALWRVKANRPFAWGMLKDPRFLRIFAIMAGLHMLWNSPLTVPLIGGNTGFFLFRILLGLVGWIVVLLLIQAGIKEVRRAQQDQQGPGGSGAVL